MNNLEIQYYEYTCLCGCGEQIKIKKYHKYYGIPKYIRGHQNLGKIIVFTELHKQNMSKVRVEKGLSKGKNNPFYGKSHSKEQKNLWKISRKGIKLIEEHKQKISITSKGRIPWNKGVKMTEEVKSKIKDGWKNKDTIIKEQLFEQHSKYISELIIKNDGVVSGTYKYKRGFCYSNKNKKEVFYASSYEKKAIDIFEQNKNIIYYERCKFYIPYYTMNKDGFFGNKKRNYIPDFIVYYKDGGKEIIEIKPSIFFGTLQNLSKFVFLEEFCNNNGYKFDIWMERDLQIKRG